MNIIYILFLMFFLLMIFKLIMLMYYKLYYKSNLNKILGLCLSEGHGGIELYFINLITNFKNNNLPIYIINKKNSFISNNLDLKKKLSIQKINFFNIFYYAYKISLFVTKNSIDTIHIGWTNDLRLAVLIKKICIHNIKIIYFRQMKITRMKTNIYHKFIYNSVNRILVITDKLKEEVERYIPYFKKENINVLRHGIKEVTQKVNIKQIINNFNKNKFNIGIFSRIEEQKGQHLVIDSLLEIYKDKGDFFNLYIIGHQEDQNYYSKLKKIVEQNNLKKNIFFINFIKDPIRIMNNFDLIILPTYEETFGLVVIESMLMKASIIGSNAGGVPEIIKNEYNGLLFESRNYKSLKNKIIFLLTNPKLKKQMIKNAYDFVIKNYDYDNHFDELKKYLLL
jgi:L-malate glycosyltransferase